MRCHAEILPASRQCLQWRKHDDSPQCARQGTVQLGDHWFCPQHAKVLRDTHRRIVNRILEIPERQL